MAGVCVAVVAFHVISLFTLLYKTTKKGGVTPWYGFVLGGTFYMIFIMIGQGLFAGAFHPNFAAIHDYQVSQNLSLIHISEPTRLGMISYAVFCLKKKK